MDVDVLGSQLRFNGHNDGYLTYLSSGGEKNLIDYAEKFIDDGSVILDVGANIGFTSAVFSIANPNGQVYALEPGEKNFQYLTGNLAINSLENVSAFRLAVSNVSGFQAFHENSAWGYLDDDAEGRVEVTTLDDFVHGNNLQRVDLVKIDVEGFEEYVFEGMQETLANFNPKVIFEFNSFCMLSYGKKNPLDFMEKISTMFSSIYRFNKTGVGEVLLSLGTRENFAIESLHQNIVIDGSVNDYLVHN